VRLWRIGRLCEEFHCLPSAMARELARDPEQMAVRIVELRGYAKAKALVDASKQDSDVPRGDPLVVRVLRTQAAILREER